MEDDVNDGYAEDKEDDNGVMMLMIMVIRKIKVMAMMMK